MININGISKSYQEHTALSKISFEVPEKSIYGLLGPNGAGKTTLIRIINQIIEADEGSIEINGEVLKHEHINLIGYLPEERGLYKKMTVSDQVVYFGRLRGLTRADARQRGKQWAERLEIDEWLDAKIEDLSKGMAQKVQFISTVLHEPPLLILDEPFSGFDPVNANRIRAEIERMRDNGTTVLFSTHRMESVEELCDHLSLISKSRLVISGEKTEIKERFRDGSYRIRFSGRTPADTGDFTLVETQAENGVLSATVRLSENATPNEVLSSFIATSTVHSFEEHIPGINDIFLKLTSEQ